MSLSPLWPRTHPPLPLYCRVVFFDWFGTLSSTLFWESITSNPRHPLSAELSRRLASLFQDDREAVLAAWMRGYIDYRRIVNDLDVTLPANYRPDYLKRALLADCRRAAITPAMADLIQFTRDHAFVAVATDNMDCFLDAPPDILRTSVRVDDLVVSAETGVLKKEDPRGFFEPALDRFQLSFRNALLVDDCADTCRAFRACGGNAVRHQTPQQTWQGVSSFLHAPLA